MGNQAFAAQNGFSPETIRQGFACTHCSTADVMFHLYIGDGFCVTCERWQMEGCLSREE